MKDTGISDEDLEFLATHDEPFSGNPSEQHYDEESILLRVPTGPPFMETYLWLFYKEQYEDPVVALKTEEPPGLFAYLQWSAPH